MRSMSMAWVLSAALVGCGGDSSGDSGDTDAGDGGDGASDDGGADASASDDGGTGSGPTGADDGTGTADDGGSDGPGDGSTATAGDDGTTGGATLDCTLTWSSGFEQGFPGEWDAYDNGSWSADGSMPPGRVSAWTIVDQASGGPIHAGDHAYKGWIEGAAGESHRAYPGTSATTPTPFVNTFWVYLDVDYDVLADEWIHFGTWGNFKDGNGLYALHTMSVRFRELEFAHTEPFAGEYVGPDPQPEFPTGQWVRFTVYGHYEGNTGFVKAWQDGVPMLQATVSQLADYPGTDLSYAHWGMYAGSTASTGIQYNDDIQVWQLDAPLSDLDTEPDCYLGS